jgi:acid phosphatase (class B)
MTNTKLPLLLVLVSGCVVDPAGTDHTPLVDDFQGGKSDEVAGARAINCYTTQPAGTLVKLTLTPNADGFDLEASSATGSVFTLAGRRPSLNVQVDSGAGGAPSEFVDFRPSGLDVVPALQTPRLELPLATGPKALVYADGSTQVQLECTVSAPRLLDFVGIAPVDSLDLTSANAVGFDIDDTLLFSTPAFGRGFATGGTPAPTDTTFWTAVNGCDPGCDAQTLTLPDGTTKELPATGASAVKSKAYALVQYHLSLGQQVYAITARPDINGDVLRDYLQAELGIDRANVYFEPVMKTDRMAALGLDVFYGDSDSDITDARKVPGRTVLGVRFERSPKSSYRDSGRLAKYHPGYFGEPIIADSYE